MRVAYCVRAIFPQHGFGGLERAATSIINHLLMRGVDVALFTRPLPVGEPFKVPAGARGRLTVHAVRYGRLPLRLRPNGIPARLTNYRAFVADTGKRVRGFVLRGDLDGIYAQGLCAWGVRDAPEWGVPLVANPHGLEEFKVRDPLKRLAYAPFRAWVRAGCRAADRVVATDKAMRGEVETLLGIDPARVVVVPNGVEITDGLVNPDLQAQLAARWPQLVAPAALKGISVGRLEANKGFENLLWSLSTLQNSLEDDWLWLLVGEGSQESRLRSLAVEVGLERHFFFAGRLSDQELHSLYAMCNLFVHPALYEGSSLVTLEAMSHALPVVASAVGGIPDKVVQGETGLLVSPGDRAQLAAKIGWMAAHPVERAQMGMRGATQAADFSWERIAQMTEGLFAMLIDQKSSCKAPEVMLRPR